jgi:hypothetical protein
MASRAAWLMACVVQRLEGRLSLFVAALGFSRAVKDRHFSITLLPAPLFGRSGRALVCPYREARRRRGAVVAFGKGDGA